MWTCCQYFTQCTPETSNTTVTCTNTVTDGLDPPVEHTDTMSSSSTGPVVYTIEQLSLQPTSLHAEMLILYSVSGSRSVNLKDVAVVFIVPLISGSVLIMYCVVGRRPVGTQERYMDESVVPTSVTLGHGGMPMRD